MKRAMELLKTAIFMSLAVIVVFPFLVKGGQLAGFLNQRQNAQLIAALTVMGEDIGGRKGLMLSDQPFDSIEFMLEANANRAFVGFSYDQKTIETKFGGRTQTVLKPKLCSNFACLCLFFNKADLTNLKKPEREKMECITFPKDIVFYSKLDEDDYNYGGSYEGLNSKVFGSMKQEYMAFNTNNEQLAMYMDVLQFEDEIFIFISEHNQEEIDARLAVFFIPI